MKYHEYQDDSPNVKKAYAKGWKRGWQAGNHAGKRERTTGRPPTGSPGRPQKYYFNTLEVGVTVRSEEKNGRRVYNAGRQYARKVGDGWRIELAQSFTSEEHEGDPLHHNGTLITRIA